MGSICSRFVNLCNSVNESRDGFEGENKRVSDWMPEVG